MSIEGKHYQLGGRHPQELVDDLYAEFFDLHPEDAVVDVALAVRPSDTDLNEEGHSRSTTVLAVRLMRVTDPVKEGLLGDDAHLTAADHRFLAVDSANPLDLLKEMLRWAKGQNAQLMWIRKTPEGYATPESQEIVWHMALVAADFALGDGKKRDYVLGGVVNRKVSRPLLPNRAGQPEPITGDAEIDYGIVSRIVLGVAETKGFGEDHPYMVAAREHLAAQKIVLGHEDEHGQPHHMAAHETIIRSAKVMGRAAAKATLEDPLSTEPEKEAAKMMLSMIEMAELAEAMKSGKSPYAGEGDLGFRPPTEPRDIFGLPKFTLPASDNTKQIGFRPPTDKDRLN